MNTHQKHIIFADATLASQTAFNAIFNSAEISITNCNSGMEAIQFIKKNEKPHLLIIEEHIKPLGALQTLNYLKDQLNYTGPVFIISESNKTIYSDTSEYKVITKEFSDADLDKINAVLKTDKRQISTNQRAYSLNYLINLSDDDQSFIFESIKIFNESVGVRIEEMNQLLKEGKFKTVRDIAHNIKPSFEMLENEKGRVVCDRIVHFAGDNEMKDLISELKMEFELVQENLKKDLPELYKEL